MEEKIKGFCKLNHFAQTAIETLSENDLTNDYLIEKVEEFKGMDKWATLVHIATSFDDDFQKTVAKKLGGQENDFDVIRRFYWGKH